MALAVGIRIHNAFTYPADWGFDASSNWRYIYRLSEDRALPDPAAGWSTADPPLYFVGGALVMSGLGAVGARDAAVVAVPLLGTLAGLGVVALAVSLVRRRAPDDELRAWLAAGLLLYLPAHAHASVMVNEEILVALLVALSVWGLAASPVGADPVAGEPNATLRRALAVGVAGGLALLTKLTGAVSVAASGIAYAAEGWRRRALRPTLRCLAALALSVLLVGGWWFVRNRMVYGFFQPFGMPAHQLMFGMPPGERGLLDYVRVPLTTWTDPQLLDPGLLHAVWASTYVAAWFDGHRFFLPRDAPAVTRLGTATLVLALLPTLAFAAGLGRGARRARERPGGADLPLLLLTAVALLGYAAYTWRNPWFAVLKGTSLSALALPFAFYASESLAAWIRRRGLLGWGTAMALAALAACAAAGFTFDGLFEKKEVPGLEWRPERGG